MTRVYVVVDLEEGAFNFPLHQLVLYTNVSENFHQQDVTTATVSRNMTVKKNCEINKEIGERKVKNQSRIHMNW